jgi:hypothetical protein
MAMPEAACGFCHFVFPVPEKEVGLATNPDRMQVLNPLDRMRLHCFTGGQDMATDCTKKCNFSFLFLSLSCFLVQFKLPGAFSMLEQQKDYSSPVVEAVTLSSSAS